MSMLIEGCAIVNVEESREIAVTKDALGNYIDSTPVGGSERAFLDLKLPGDVVVRAEVSAKDFDAHVTPTLQENVST